MVIRIIRVIMSNLYTHQDSNTRKTWALMAAFFIGVIFIGWGFSLAFGSPAILYVAVAFSILMNVFSYWYSDKIVLKMSGAIPADEREYRELHNIVENLAITAGLLEDVPRVDLDYFPELPHFTNVLPQIHLQVNMRGRTMENSLHDFLKKCHVSVRAQGCEVSNAGDISADSSHEECRLNIKQIRKTARLAISVFVGDGDTHRIAGPLTRYIRRAE